MTLRRRNRHAPRSISHYYKNKQAGCYQGANCKSMSSNKRRCNPLFLQSFTHHLSQSKTAASLLSWHDRLWRVVNHVYNKEWCNPSALRLTNGVQEQLQGFCGIFALSHSHTYPMMYIQSTNVHRVEHWGQHNQNRAYLEPHFLEGLCSCVNIVYGALPPPHTKRPGPVLRGSPSSTHKEAWTRATGLSLLHTQRGLDPC